MCVAGCRRRKAFDIRRIQERAFVAFVDFNEMESVWTEQTKMIKWFA